MKKLLTAICVTFLLATTAIAQDTIRWRPVCRHKAIYWAATVAEQYPTRIMYGVFVDKTGIKYPHVQPQLYMGEKWWYFAVENNHVVIITKPTFTTILPNGEEEKATWLEKFHWPSLTSYMEYLKNIHVKGPK